MPKVDRWLDVLEQGEKLDLPPAVAAAVRLFNQGTPVGEALNLLLKQILASREQETQGLKQTEIAIDREEQALRDEFVTAILEFLAKALPGALTPQATEALRANPLLLRALKTSVEDLGARLNAVR